MLIIPLLTALAQPAPLPPTPPLPPIPSVEATRDLFAMDETVDVDSAVADNAFVMARSVGVHAPVGGDVFSMGEEITIDQPVAGDVYAMGATVVVTEEGSIGGNLTVFAGELDLRGSVGGDVHAQVGELHLAAPIVGDLDLSTERLTIESSAKIGGDLAYASTSPYPALESATLGHVEHTLELPEVVQATKSEPPSLLSRATWWAGMRGWGFFTKFLVGSLLFFLGGSWIAGAGRRITSHPGASLGIGFVATAAIPILSTAALVTVLPFPVGVLGFTLFGILLYIGQLFTAQALGDFLLQRFRPDAVGSPYISLAVGLVPLMVLFALPLIGGIGWLVATAAGIGGLVSIVRGRS